MSLSASLATSSGRAGRSTSSTRRAIPASRATRIAALRVVEGALFVVSGVMGVEVGTTRLWKRAEELGLSRVLVVNMLDRERADFFRVLEALRAQLSERCVAVHLPIGGEHELTGIVDLLHMSAYMSPEGGEGGRPGEIPAEMPDQVRSTARSCSTPSSRRTRG